MVVALPEAFVEARNTMGSNWDAWAGARWLRYDDIHIDDYFYFDDHSATGWGVKYKNTRFSMFFPADMDTASVNNTPYSYTNIISGIKDLVYRQREVFVFEHHLYSKNRKHDLKLLAEFHYLNPSGERSLEKYPSDRGFVVGAKLSSPVRSPIPGSFNQLSVRLGTGIANGGENGNTQTWRTFDAPDEKTRTYENAYSVTAVEHFLCNLNKNWSVNGYAVFTQSKGGNSSQNTATDYYGKEITNFKKEFNTGFRATYFLTDWFHLLAELHYATRKDGTQPSASMIKAAIAPTISPTGERSVWARPHIRLIAEIARYNSQAMHSLYSSFLEHSGARRYGVYLGARAEWWIF